jgi:hypothetical protein
MTGVKGKSGRRIAAPSTLDKLCTLADTIVLRAIRNPELPELERAKLASQFSLKKIAERRENVNVNFQLSDELMNRVLAVMRASRKEIPAPPAECVIEAVEIDASDNAPNDGAVQ